MLFASYRSPKAVVRPSRIGGRGLFAAAPIRRGEVVSVKGGNLLDRAGMAAHGGAVGDAELQVTDDLFLAPVGEAEFDEVMMFLNHSCEPNVGVQGQIVFVAMRDVAAGAEAPDARRGDKRPRPPADGVPVRYGRVPRGGHRPGLGAARPPAEVRPVLRVVLVGENARRTRIRFR